MQTRFGLYVIALLSAAGAGCGYLQGVCRQGECNELSHGCQHTAYNQYPPLPVSLFDPPKCQKAMYSCHNYHCGDCEDISPEQWPNLNVTLEYYNKYFFGVAISWEQPAEVSGYVLLLTTEQHRGRCGGEGVSDLNECECANITNPNTTTHTYTHYYLDDNELTPKTVHIKLIPTPWCDGPSITIPIPKTCHNILPGNCNICGIQNPTDIKPPTNVHLMPLPLLRGVFLSWELGESYYGLPYPNISFFLQIHNVANGSEATQRLEVVGKANVTLQNFNLNNNYSVQIRAADCGCGQDLSSPVYFYLSSEPVSTSSLVSTTEPVPTSSLVSTVSTPVPTQESDPDSAVIVIVLSTVVAAGLVITTVVLAAVVFNCKRCKTTYTNKPCEENLMRELNWIQEPDFNPRLPARNFPFNDDPPVHVIDPIVLVIYSPDSPEEDQKLALEFLVSGLSNYSIQTKCHDCSSIRQSAPLWLQLELRRASTVLCVCNAQFQREWDQEITSLLPLVSSLRELVYGLLNQSIPLSRKFAIVLLRESDHKHIPCDYLHSTRSFLVTDVEDIALFVNGTPKYVTP